MSTNSGRSSSNSSESSAETVQRNFPTNQFQYFRRQTPEEDYLSTQQGIEILVQERQQLVDQLTVHYRKLQRSNEIEKL